MDPVNVNNSKTGANNWFRENFLWLLLLSVSLAIVTSYFNHYIYVSSTNPVLLSNDHLDVVSFKAKAPMQYRLAPYFIEQWILDAAVNFGAPNNSVTLIFIDFCVRTVLTTLGYLALLLFFGVWFDLRLSLIGLLFFVAVNPLAEFSYYHQPGDPFNLLFFILGYFAIAQNLDYWLLPILFFGVPFHESIALLIPAYIAARFGAIPYKTIIFRTVLLCIALCIPYFAIRILIGHVPNYITEQMANRPYSSVLTENLLNPKGWWVLFLTFNVLWFVLPAAWGRLPQVVRRMFIIVPIYLLVYLIYGRFVEGRNFRPLLPLFLVAGLMWLGKEFKDSDFLSKSPL